MTIKTNKSSKQYYDDTEFRLTAPENYERYFVPVIGKPLAKDLIQLANLRQGEKVLDVGCGTGIVAKLAVKQVGESGTATGLDINPAMLSVARSTTSPRASIEWIEASAESMPFPDENFDVVLCQLSFQFMEDKPTALKEMQRILAPGGRLILNVPGPAGKIFTTFAKVLERNISTEAAEFANHVFSLHDANELQQLMRGAHFREIDIQAEYKILKLPAPKEFLWQYIHSTPMADIVSKATTEAREALERKIVEKWQKFQKDGSMYYQQPVISARAWK